MQELGSVANQYLKANWRKLPISLIDGTGALFWSMSEIAW
jgi:hypothetical protein